MIDYSDTEAVLLLASLESMGCEYQGEDNITLHFFILMLTPILCAWYVHSSFKYMRCKEGRAEIITDFRDAPRTFLQSENQTDFERQWV